MAAGGGPRPWVRTLERAPAGAARGAERRLLGAGGFRALVQPCLPGARGGAGAGLRAEGGGAGGGGAEAWPLGAARVQTVPAQLAARWGRAGALRERLLRAAAAGPAGSGIPAPQALLLVSGGHPWRTRLTRPFLASSFDLLRAAAELRAGGELPADTGLWAVENPLRARGSAARLERKLEAGAETVVTQPPLLPGRFESWWGDLLSRGLHRDARVLVGVPFLTSPENLRFWLRLADCDPDDPEAAPALRTLSAHPPGPERQEASLALAAETLRWVEGLPGAAGVHLMPVTPAGYRCAEAVLAAGDYQ